MAMLRKLTFSSLNVVGNWADAALNSSKSNHIRSEKFSVINLICIGPSQDAKKCKYIFGAIYYHNVEHWPETCFCIVFLTICCGVSLFCCFVSVLLCCKFCVVFLALYDVALDANAVATVNVLLFCGCYVPVSVAVCGVALDASVVTTLPTNIGLSSSNSFPSSSFGSVQACHLHKKLKSKFFLTATYIYVLTLPPTYFTQLHRRVFPC